MKKLVIDLNERSYPVIIEVGANQNLYSYLKKIPKLPHRGAFITNRKIFNLYPHVFESLNKAGMNLCLILVPDGEKAKSLFWAEKIYHRLIKWKCSRQSILIAFGGGVVGDLTGFVAATYLRGVPFIQVPTTLLSQVDSSVGGKVAVNLKEGKNLIGNFYQPKAVVIDPLSLKTLDRREFRNGMAEVIKYALIRDAGFFRFLQKYAVQIQNFEADVLEKMIFTSVRNKAEVVSQDEKESGIRATLNFGHTFGHSIEKTWGYKRYSHGEGVAIGMNMACRYSLLTGNFSETEREKLKKLFQSFNLDTRLPLVKRKAVYDNLFFDKKVTDKGLTLILLDKIGKSIIQPEVDILKLKKFVFNYNAEKDV